ncbi:LysE type translocator [Acinetobacter calcoaceticus]|uniref:LysE type translocator n=1 Tax=Acinetobacter calcoaceticus TaxID=471 RepID=A0A4V2R097_ACICA|nr:LysE type translocator [Acinetobacter calcoaceticus]
MYELALVMVMTILAVLSPGADFALVTRNSYLYGRKHGVATAFGIAMGVWVHVAYSSILILFSMFYLSTLLIWVKYLGALYLMYLAFNTFFQRPVEDMTSTVKQSVYRTFQQGILTNTLNPKNRFICYEFDESKYV